MLPAEKSACTFLLPSAEHAVVCYSASGIAAHIIAVGENLHVGVDFVFQQIRKGVCSHEPR